MDNPFLSAFSGGFDGMGQQSHHHRKTPQMSNYFSSEEVLGRPDAQNTAQRANSTSNQLQEAFKAVQEGQKNIYGSMGLHQTPSGWADKSGNIMYGNVGQQSPEYVNPLAGVNFLPSSSEFTGRGSQAMMGISGPSKTFAGSFYDVDSGGKLKTEMAKISEAIGGGWSSIMGGGGDFSAGEQTSTSNVAPRIFDKKGNRIQYTHEQAMQKGLPEGGGRINEPWKPGVSKTILGS